MVKKMTEQTADDILMDMMFEPLIKSVEAIMVVLKHKSEFMKIPQGGARLCVYKCKICGLLFYTDSIADARKQHEVAITKRG